MKTNRVVLSLAAALFTSTVSFQAHACGVSVGFSIPFFSFGIGLGIGAPYAWPGGGYYGYSHPAYAYCPPANDPPPVAAAPSAPPVADPPPWTPASPGLGHWVPDPQPYVPPPAAVAQKAPTSSPSPTQSTLPVIKSPGTVPVYVASQ